MLRHLPQTSPEIAMTPMLSQSPSLQRKHAHQPQANRTPPTRPPRQLHSRRTIECSPALELSPPRPRGNREALATETDTEPLSHGSAPLRRRRFSPGGPATKHRHVFPARSRPPGIPPAPPATPESAPAPSAVHQAQGNGSVTPLGTAHITDMPPQIPLTNWRIARCS